MLNRLLLSILLLLLAACTKHRLPEDQAHTFDVRGIVREALDPKTSELTIEHENIPGYMPSMIVPFFVKEPQAAQGFARGDGIQFQLFITQKEAWIAGLKKISASTVQIGPPKQQVRKVSVPRVKVHDLCPDFALIDQSGWPVTKASYRHSMFLITFMYTGCTVPSSCALMAQNFEAIQKAVAADPDTQGKLKLLSVSIDPDNDTPAHLADYAANHTKDTENWRFATGSADQIASLTSAFSVYVQPEGDTISHGLCTALIGADGVIIEIWRGNAWTPDEVVSTIKTVLGH
jgi:protein SCO1/2